MLPVQQAYRDHNERTGDTADEKHAGQDILNAHDFGEVSPNDVQDLACPLFSVPLLFSRRKRVGLPGVAVRREGLPNALVDDFALDRAVNERPVEHCRYVWSQAKGEDSSSVFLSDFEFKCHKT